MKLYVLNKEQKIYINHDVNTREELRSTLGSDYFTVENTIFTVDQVVAEKDSSATAAAVLGGFIGALGGPFGVVLGSLTGALLGSSSDDADQRKVDIFNGSR